MAARSASQVGCTTSGACAKSSAYVVSLVGACVGGFVLTWLFGIDDERIEELYGA